MPARVTASAEVIERQKDPKKVAAGKAGAAARKAKQHKLLAELREVKAAMSSSAICEPEPRAHQEPICETRTVNKTTEPQALSTRTCPSDTTCQATTPDWTPWIVGGIGLAAGLTWYTSCSYGNAIACRGAVLQRTSVRPAMPTQPAQSVCDTTCQANANPQLKPSDPFHME